MCEATSTTTSTTLPGGATFALTLGGSSVALTLTVYPVPAMSEFVVTGISAEHVKVYFCAFDTVSQAGQTFPVTPVTEDSCDPCPLEVDTCPPWHGTFSVPPSVDLRQPFVLRWHGIALAVG